MPLHPQSQSFLDAIAEQGGPSWHEMAPAAGREKFNELIELFGNRVELERVEDRTTESGIKVRVYDSTAKSEERRPAVMYFHGGGWVLGNIETHDALCRKLAVATGFTIVSVEYGLAPEHKFPGPLHDCFEATKFVAEHSIELGVDSSRIAVAGDSAGGNLAAAVSIMTRDDANLPPIAMQVLIYPVIEANFDSSSYLNFASGYGLSLDEMKWFWNQYIDDASQQRHPLASLPHNPSLSGLPPAHILTAEYDVLRDEGEKYAEMLSSAGVATTVRRYDGMLHGFVHLQGVFDMSEVAIENISQELKNTLLD